MGRPIPTFQVPPNRQSILRAALPSGKDQEAAFNPDDFEWAPNVQVAYEIVVAGKTGYIPPGPGSLADASFNVNDLLENKSVHPMLVRAITLTSQTSAAGFKGYRIGSRKKGESPRFWHTPGVQIQDGFLHNQLNAGPQISWDGPTTARARRRFDLWKPYLLKDGESITFSYGNSLGNSKWGSFSREKGIAFIGLGVQSGKAYVLTNTDYSSPSVYIEGNVENIYGEDILLQSINIHYGTDGSATGKNEYVGLTFEPSQGPKMSTIQRAIRHFGVPYVRLDDSGSNIYSGIRHVFDYLPHGALLLEPGEGLVAEIQSATAAQVDAFLAWEGYVVRGRKGDI